ncbi:MAG TPA: endonuclease MutS2 [Rhodothermales bacterium]
MTLSPSSAADKLGFGAVRARIGEHLRSALGEEALAAARPSSDRETVRAELTAVGEVQQIVRFDDPLPLRNLEDVRTSLRRAQPREAYLEPPELGAVRAVLETIRLLAGYFTQRRERYPELAKRAAALTPLPHVEEAIARVVDDQGGVRDDASPELRRLRHSIVRAQNDLRSTLQRELRNAIGHGYATEEQPTVRGGRMVIPIRAEAKRKIAGFVHDTSASGQTVYVEPAACLDLNNEVRELESAERQEVLRILREVTSAIRAHVPETQRSLSFLGWFDYAHARALLANELNAVVPSLNAEGRVDIVHGRNPSLLVHFRQAETGREVVPLDLRLDAERRTLVITGPNAGGKTVAMKSVGLLVLMLGYGIPIPVDEKSDLCVFPKLLVDIGDEQSIEQDLSTFSSHTANLARMLREAGPDALILIDEAGTGTDPEEGAALARAVLEELTARGARTIATTHHGALKAFAHEAAHVENGSMAFNEETLEPTYQFRIGVPGSSYAFPISRRQGLPDSVLERAAELLGTQKASFEELIATFEQRSRTLEVRLEELERLRSEAEAERTRFQERLEALQSERATVREQALREAERVVNEANARIERTIREIREAQAEREVTRAARESLDRYSADVQARRRRAERKSRRRPRQQAQSGETTAIRPGDRVVLDNGSTAAEVLEVDDGSATIAFGSTRLRADLSRLTRVSGATARKRERRREARPASTDAMRSLQAQTSVDVRGMRAHEALAAVTRLIDDAVAANLDEVEILHGKGTGALRQAIREDLERNSFVAGFEDAPWDRGGPGVTVVRLG